jgi:hypothetical protein
MHEIRGDTWSRYFADYELWRRSVCWILSVSAVHVLVKVFSTLLPQSSLSKFLNLPEMVPHCITHRPRSPPEEAAARSTPSRPCCQLTIETVSSLGGTSVLQARLYCPQYRPRDYSVDETLALPPTYRYALTGMIIPTLASIGLTLHRSTCHSRWNIALSSVEQLPVVRHTYS